ncbi:MULTISPECIES: GNAT family N-acetyltransferase [Exiguobacterium]|uniref:GNAT family N-acetyltransferase n=1 Tax=Exiguobacterium TaxID=33986 RepID=UPI001BE8EEE7|nr:MULTISPECIES: GNAT family N-acetyltransferase [Exiguobacterium]MCT4776825.1 GNAT family N-acetyltransferase [Exiguobacterium aquaticum]MCT4788263.1 GNAT family N-acetyltransferase [Exiguobacterium mexicanum]
MISIALAKPSDVNAIERLYHACKDDLLARQIFQWDDTYPNGSYFEACIEEGSVYIMKGGEQLIGVVVLDEWQSPEWETIDWRHDHPLVIHSLMVHPERQGQGSRKAILHASEQFAKTEGYTSIRLDSFSGNEAACNFYKRHGYVERGSVHFDSKPKGHERYICFEKALD